MKKCILHFRILLSSRMKIICVATNGVYVFCAQLRLRTFYFTQRRFDLMKMDVIFTAFLLVVVLTVSFFIVHELKRKRRFAKHRLIRGFVDCWSSSMVERITQAATSEKERFFVIAEQAKVSDDSILSECCSIFFSHEHMCRLRTERERRLMAYAIAGQLKKRLIAKCSSVDVLAGKKYKIKTKCKSVLGDSHRNFLVHIHYISPNESYVREEKW